MGRIKLKVKISEAHFHALKLIVEKYGVDFDRGVEMAIERLFLSEHGILLVPKNIVDKKGVIILDEYGDGNITAFK